MSDVLKRPAPSDAEYRAEAARLSREMDRLFKQMDNDRAASDRLKSETKEISNRIDTMLAELECQVRVLSGAA